MTDGDAVPLPSRASLPAKVSILLPSGSSAELFPILFLVIHNTVDCRSLDGIPTAMLFLVMVLVKQQDMQLGAGYFGSHVWFFDVHIPPGLFSCKPSKATPGKWVSSCKVRAHYAETKPFLGATKAPSCSLVNLQKQCRVYFLFTMTSTEEVLSSPLLSHLFSKDISIFRPRWTMLSSMPNFSAGRELDTHKWEWCEILSNYIWYQASWKFVFSRLDCAIIPTV